MKEAFEGHPIGLRTVLRMVRETARKEAPADQGPGFLRSKNAAEQALDLGHHMIELLAPAATCFKYIKPF